MTATITEATMASTALLAMLEDCDHDHDCDIAHHVISIIIIIISIIISINSSEVVCLARGILGVLMKTHSKNLGHARACVCVCVCVSTRSSFKSCKKMQNQTCVVALRSSWRLLLQGQPESRTPSQAMEWREKLEIGWLRCPLTSVLVLRISHHLCTIVFAVMLVKLLFVFQPSIFQRPMGTQLVLGCRC